jgi:hypothetical protein
MNMRRLGYRPLNLSSQKVRGRKNLSIKTGCIYLGMPQGRKINYLIGLSGVMLVVREVIVYVLKQPGWFSKQAQAQKKWNNVNITQRLFYRPRPIVNEELCAIHVVGGNGRRKVPRSNNWCWSQCWHLYRPVICYGYSYDRIVTGSYASVTYPK